MHTSLVKRGAVGFRVIGPQSGNWAMDWVVWHSLLLSLFSWDMSTCQDLSEVGCKTEEPLYLTVQTQPILVTKKVAFMSALWHREAESTHLWTSLEVCQHFSSMLILACLASLVLRDFLSLSLLLLSSRWLCFLTHYLRHALIQICSSKCSE